MNTIKELRIEKNLTQKQAAEEIGISLRSFISYENDSSKEGSMKYNYIVSELQKINPIDENHGLLSMKDIKDKCSKVFEKYDVEYCILFGSYAKEKAKETSDVDLLVSSSVKGITFFGMIEELRETLHKKVDVIELSQLANNMDLVSEILKDGIKIYG